MGRSFVSFRRALALVPLVLLVTSAAHAQATRTWVSGVGDDANPCSRTAPCKTFAGAISKTAAGGEINVLDPGGFGGVTITKSISIEAEGVIAGVLVSGTNAIIVNAGVNDVVVLRGLVIEGLGTGLDGIKFLNGGALYVENCTINHFATNGINISPTASGVTTKVFVTGTTVRNSIGTGAGGMMIKPTGGASVVASIDGSRFERNQFGFRIEDNTKATVRDSIAVGNANAGFSAISVGGPTILNLQSATTAGNGTAGVRADGSGVVVDIADVRATGNATGLSVNLGAIRSFGNNSISGNTVDGTATSSLNQQ